jgi:hypothetical protein
MSKWLLRLSSAALVLGPVLLASLAGGCGPSTSAAICDALCTCTPCTDNDLADCKASADAAAQQSQGTCATLYDTYLTCAHDNVRCHDPQALNTKCLDEITALIRCDPTLPIIGTPCAAAPIKIAVCLGTTASVGGVQTTCVGQQACTSKCTLAATCPQIKDVFSGSPPSIGQPLLDCFNACSKPQGS